MNRALDFFLILLLLHLIYSCKQELDIESITTKELEELVNPDDVLSQLKFEVETIEIFKSGISDRVSNPIAERMRVNFIIDKSNTNYLEVEHLMPERIDLVRHETQLNPEVPKVAKIKMIDDQIYTFDKQNNPLDKQQGDMKPLIDDYMLMMDEKDKQSNFLKPVIQKMSVSEIENIETRKQLTADKSTKGVISFSGSLYNGNAQNRKESEEKITEYYDENTGLMKGIQVWKNNLIVMRAAYIYEIKDEEAYLKLIHSVKYRYDNSGTLIDESVTNSYFTIL